MATGDRIEIGLQPMLFDEYVRVSPSTTTIPVFTNYNDMDLDSEFGSEYSDLSPSFNSQSKPFSDNDHNTLNSKYFDNTLNLPQRSSTDVKYATNDNINIYVDVTPGSTVAESSFSKIAYHIPEGMFIHYTILVY